MNKLLKKKQRMRLLTVINSNPDWSNNEEALQKVQNLAEPLFVNRPPFPETKLDWQNFKRSDFLFLLSLGYGTKDLEKIYKVSQLVISKWREDQGFSEQTKEEIIYRYSNEVVKARKNKRLSDYGIQP
ncbi:hypothetical protein [Enterococcus sp. AZ103]|uniref:hypothetical protein n=1 Tax=Enterococcus sp. AZ103 TaxID=2774628 RepID=UPI003F2526D3